MEREAFLGRVRTATDASSLPTFEAPAPPPIPLEGDPIARWEESAVAIGVHVHHATTANDTRERVRMIAEAAGARDFCAWDDERLPVHGIAAYLATAGLTEHVVGAGPHTALEGVGLGVTGGEALLAETGSVVVTTGPGRPRLASLVGDVHVAVVPVDRVVPSLRAWLDDTVGDDTANTVVITGPSRTGDIEGILVQGVHGPREVHVVLVG